MTKEQADGMVAAINKTPLGKKATQGPTAIERKRSADTGGWEVEIWHKTALLYDELVSMIAVCGTSFTAIVAPGGVGDPADLGVLII